MYMKIIKLFPRFLIPVVTALMLFACTAAPVQEMSDARQALQAARAAGAEDLAKSKFQDAKTHLEQAESMLEKGDYSHAKKNALEAKKKAIDAREQALKSNK